MYLCPRCIPDRHKLRLDHLRLHRIASSPTLHQQLYRSVRQRHHTDPSTWIESPRRKHTITYIYHLFVDLTNPQLGVLTFASKAEFLAAQGAQPNIPFKILNLWNTCDTVIIRWLSAQSPLPVQGISIATVQPAIAGQGGGVGVGPQKWQINRVLAEVNSGAWLGNLGYPECAGTANAATS